MTDTSLARIETLAAEALASLPEPFASLSREVLLRVVDWPPQDVLEELGIDDPLELTGLYDGVPVTRKSVSEPCLQPDVVWLFREPILAEWRDRGNVTLDELVTHIVVHEIAHHFGWSDDDIAAVDPWWE